MNAMWTMGGNRSIIPFTHTANRPSWLPQYAYSRFRLERTQSSWVFPYEFQMKQHFNDFIRWSAWVVQCDNLDSPNEGTSCQMRQCPRVSAGVSGVAGRLKVTRLSPWFIQSNVSLDIITYPIWAMFISAIYIYKHMYVYIYTVYIYPQCICIPRCLLITTTILQHELWEVALKVNQLIAIIIYTAMFFLGVFCELPPSSDELASNGCHRFRRNTMPPELERTVRGGAGKKDGDTKLVSCPRIRFSNPQWKVKKC